MFAKAWWNAQRRLQRVTRAAYLHLCFPVHTEHNILLALYSNWSKEDEEMSEEHEQIVLEALKRELDLPLDEMPMWYSDVDEE